MTTASEPVRALVLAGGGSRGAYQIGAWKALRELGYEFSVVTGTSVGALNAAVVAMDDPALAEDLWQQISTDKVLDYEPLGDISTLKGQRDSLLEFLEKAIKDKSIDQTPLLQLLHRYVDVEKIYASPVEVGITTVTYPDLKPKQVFKNDIPKEQFIDYLMGSSACFPAMKAWDIGGVQHIDGGYYDNLPIQQAIDRGATQVVAIDLGAPGIKQSYNKKKAKVLTVAPREDLGFILFFDGDLAKANLRRGYLDTMKTFGVYDGWAFTFAKKTFDEDREPFHDFLNRLMETALPGGKAGILAHKLARKLMTVKMELGTSRRTFMRNPLATFADSAGKIFGLPPQEIYEKDRFVSQVLQKLEEVDDNPFDGDIAEAFTVITEETVRTKLLVQELERVLASGKTAKPHQLALAATDALPAAIFCLYYKQKCHTQTNAAQDAKGELL